MAGVLYCGGLNLAACATTTTTSTRITSTTRSSSSIIAATTLTTPRATTTLLTSTIRSTSSVSNSALLLASTSITSSVLPSTILTSSTSRSSSSSAGTSSASTSSLLSSSSAQSSSAPSASAVSTSTSPFSSSASPTPSGLACPAADGQTITTGDGSQYLIVCNKDYSPLTQNVFGLNPLAATSYAACITLCSNQGSVCTGVTYGLFGGSTLQCNLKTRMLQNNLVPAYTVDSAVRLSGPSGVSGRTPLISNGNFSNSLNPWTTDSFTFDTTTGAASMTSALTNFGGYRAGELVQAASVAAGVNYYLSFSLRMNLSGVLAPTDYCSFYGQTDYEILFFFSPNLASNGAGFASNFNASGTTTGASSRFIFFAYCRGSFTVTWTIDDVVLYTYSPTNGTNVLAPAFSAPALTNGDFANGLQNWAWVSTGLTSVLKASFGVASIVGSLPQLPTAAVAAGTAMFNNLSPIDSGMSNGYLVQSVLVDPGQTFRITANVFFNVSSSCSCDSGIYNTLYAQSGVNGWAWSTFGITSKQQFSINVTGITYASNRLFQMYAGCSGTDPLCAVAFSNVAMTLNI